MKRTGIFIACTVYSFMMAMDPIPTLSIENHYGEIVLCDTNSQNIAIASNGNPVKIGTVELGDQVFCNSVNKLSIKTMWSSKTVLDNLLEEVVEQSYKNRDKEAVLMIKESRRWQDWNIDLVWRKKDKYITTFSMQSPEEDAQTPERQLQLGKNGSEKQFLDLIEKHNLYGHEYACKVKELHEVNYEAATRRNACNLSIYSKLHSFGYKTLLCVLSGIRYNYDKYLNYAKYNEHDHTGNRTPDEVKDFVKRIIDEQYATFLLYKQYGWLD